ncbi:MAG: hypothetical protein Q9160_006115 [Pyrenula sp. 1 TL-2023]
MRTSSCFLAIHLAFYGCIAANVACPEDIGAILPACENAICGGEDPANVEHCKNASPGGPHCDKNAQAGPQSSSVVTASQSGKIVTGTYALETITSLSSLRQSITTTITASPKTSGGPAETAAAVILAGGVAWMLAGEVGDAVIAEAVLQAPEAPKGHEDDKTCPVSENKCSDCGGVSGICTTKDGGCRYDKPDCAGDKCEEVDGKCTNQSKGCACCYKFELTPFCDDCGGADGKKCKGINDKDNKYKGCDCLEKPPPLTPYKPLDVQDPKWKNGLPAYGKDPYTKDGSSSDPTCDIKQDGQVTYQWYRGLYPAFCKQIPDKTKTSDKDLTNKDWKDPNIITNPRLRPRGLLEDRTPPPSPTQYPNHKFSFHWKPRQGSCMKDCNQAFQQITDSQCGHTSAMGNSMTQHGDLDIGCGVYSWDIIPPPPPPPAISQRVTCRPGETTPKGSFWHCDPDQPNCRTAATQPDGKAAYYAAIHQYCFGNYNWNPIAGDELSSAYYAWFDTTTIDTATNLPQYCLGAAVSSGDHGAGPGATGPGKTYKCKNNGPGWHGVMGSNSKVSLLIRQAEDTKDCPPVPTKKHSLVEGDACEKTFRLAVDACRSDPEWFPTSPILNPQIHVTQF